MYQPLHILSIYIDSPCNITITINYVTGSEIFLHQWTKVFEAAMYDTSEVDGLTWT